MNLSLVSIEAEGFRNLAKYIAISLDTLTPGLYYVRGANRARPRLGPNGVGKSSIFAEAPTWCLYGTTATGLRASDVRSWGSKSQPVVSVGLRVDKTHHLVTRGPRPTDIVIDGKSRAPEDIIAIIGGLTHDAWCQAVVWGQGRPLFFDLAPAAKMALLSDALGLERWERRAKAAGERAKRLEDRLAGLTGELRGLETAHEHAKEALKSAQDAAEVWGKEHSSKVKELAVTMTKALAERDAAETRRGEADLAADSAGTAAKLLRPDVEAALAAHHRVKYAAQAATETMHRLSAEGTDLRAQQGSLGKGVCPTCGQRITSPKSADKHAREIAAKLATATRQIKAARRDQANLTREAAELEERLARDTPRLTELDAAYERAMAALRMYEREAAAAGARYSAAVREHDAVAAETNPHRGTIADARVRIREVAAEITEKKSLADRCAASAERAAFWARGFREIRLGIIDEVLTDLRETAAEVLDGVGLGDWSVEFATERETKSGTTQRALHVSIRSPEAPEGVRWEVYSGGERQRLRIAGALALSEVLLAHAGVRVDFRVLDEPTHGLSAEGVRDMCEVLEEYARSAGVRILYIDHQAQEGSAFSGTIEVARNADNSVSVSMG